MGCQFCPFWPFLAIFKPAERSGEGTKWPADDFPLLYLPHTVPKHLLGSTRRFLANPEHLNNRTVVRSRVTRSVNSLQKIIDGDDPFVIRELLQCIQKARDDLADYDNQIQFLMVTNLDAMEADSEISQVGWLDPALKWIAAAKKRIMELETPAATVAPSTPSASSGASSKVKLPKVSPPDLG